MVLVSFIPVLIYQSATLSTVSHAHHRLRRIPMNKMFSKASISKLESLIHSTIDGLITRLRELQETQKVVTMSLAWTCVTMDIISDYAFGKSYNYVQTSREFRTRVRDATDSIAKSGYIVKQMPWIIPLMKKIPYSVMRILYPTVVDLLIFQDVGLLSLDEARL